MYIGRNERKGGFVCKTDKSDQLDMFNILETPPWQIPVCSDIMFIFSK